MADRPLSASELAFLAVARYAVLATVAPDGNPRLVPICFVAEPPGPPHGRPTLWTPLDDKPKSAVDPHDLARVRDVLARPRVTVLVHRWSEDWSELGWLRVRGSASLVDPGDPDHHRVVRSLRAKYPQYSTHGLEGRPLIRIVVDAPTSWGALAAPADGASRGP